MCMALTARPYYMKCVSVWSIIVRDIHRGGYPCICANQHMTSTQVQFKLGTLLVSSACITLGHLEHGSYPTPRMRTAGSSDCSWPV